MAAITSTTESWNGHKFSEVESHLKGNYLQLGGGTMTGGVTFNYGDANTDQFISFKASDNIIYKIGIRRPASTYGLTFDNGTEYKKIWHEGNLTPSNYSLTSHTHSNYSLTSHTHSYVPLSGGTMTGNLLTTGVSGAGTSNNLVFRHLDGQNCEGNYDLYLQYVNNSNSKDTKVFFGGTTYYIDKGYYNGKSETAGRVGDGSLYLYCSGGDEVNFGGSTNTDTIYFGFRATDSKPFITNYKFGGSSVSAVVWCQALASPSIVSYVLGTGTYNIMRWQLFSDRYEFEFPNTTDSSSGTHVPIYFGWRGGIYPLTIASNTNVGISTTSPSYKLHVSGDIYATGGITSASDERMKDVVTDTLPLSVEQIAKAPTVKFTWKNNHEDGEQVGTIAQYWQSVLPEVVKDKSGELSLQYGVTALVSSITTARKVVGHEKEIKALKAKINVLEERISELEG